MIKRFNIVIKLGGEYDMYLYVRGFADSRSQIKSDLRGATKVVMNHLIKIWLYPNVQEQNHWKKEVAQSLNDVPKLKGKNRYPNYKFLMDNTWKIYEDGLYDRIQVIVDSIAETPIQFDIDDIYSAVHRYFQWICEELSNRGIVKYSEIYNQIEIIRNIFSTNN